MKMLIGLTGRTGSGKSSAAKIFEDLGCFVADCDKVAHKVLLDDEIKNKLCSLFNEDILNKENEIDRKKLGTIVFSDKEKLALLNGIVHKAIVQKCLELCENSGRDICLMDGSELESSGADELCKYIVVITADEETRLKRIMQRDGIDKDSALRRIHAQSDYSKAAIYVDNGGNEEELRKKITSLYDQFSGEINV
ncbi:MAG: dephospho-CoA kinase [Ruminococcaceae bacterium]|nr:dephospho-CoA kinase [Oscillospiraceae bacterium]